MIFKFFKQDNDISKNCPEREQTTSSVKLNKFQSNETQKDGMCTSASENALFHKEYIRKFFENSACESLEIVFTNEHANCRNSFIYVTFPNGCKTSYDSSSNIYVDDLFLFENNDQQSCSCGNKNSEILNLSKKNEETSKK